VNHNFHYLSIQSNTEHVFWHSIFYHTLMKSSPGSDKVVLAKLTFHTDFGFLSSFFSVREKPHSALISIS